MPKPVEKRSTTLGSAQFGLWLIELIVFLGAAYSNSFRAAFVYDDKTGCLEQPDDSFDFSAERILSSRQETPTAGRPLVNFTLAVNYALGGVDVFGYHAVNWGFHLLNAVWLMVWLSLTVSVADRSRSLGWFAKTTIGCVVLLWAFISAAFGSRDLCLAANGVDGFLPSFLTTLMLSHLSRICSRLSTRFHLHVGSRIGVCLGMACKEVMVVAPLLVVLVRSRVLRRRLENFATKPRPILPLSVRDLGRIGVAHLFESAWMSAGFAVRIGVFDYLTTQFWAVVWYLRLAFWPSGLCGDYGATTITQIDRWLPCFAILMSLGIATIVGWFSGSSFAFWGCWFFLILAPSSSFVPIATEPIAVAADVPAASVGADPVDGSFASRRPKNFSFRKRDRSVHRTEASSRS